MSIGDNPYIAISKLMQGSDSKSNDIVKIGEVLSITPIRIKFANMELDLDDLFFLRGVRASLHISDMVFLFQGIDGQDYYVLGAVE